MRLGRMGSLLWSIRRCYATLRRVRQTVGSQREAGGRSMDITGAIRSAPLVDLGILIGLGVFFFLGVLQGAIRRLIGIGSMLVAFLVAGNLRDPLGGFFGDNWTQFDRDYNKLLAFIIVFALVGVASSIVTQGFYKRTDISAQHPIIDDVIGGLLGLLQGAILLLFVVIILNSYILPPAQSGDVTYLRTAQDLIVNQSHLSIWLEDHIVPGFVHIMSFLLPSDLVTLFP
jgi:uncharacterized membrane protein required for colicin V production